MSLVFPFIAMQSNIDLASVVDVIGSWACPICGYSNLGATDFCLNCFQNSRICRTCRRPITSDVCSFCSPTFFRPVKEFIEPIKKVHLHKIRSVPYMQKMKIKESFCAICTENYKYAANLAFMPCCKRSVHHECVSKWFDSNHTCIYCAHSFPFDRVEKKC